MSNKQTSARPLGGQLRSACKGKENGNSPSVLPRENWQIHSAALLTLAARKNEHEHEKPSHAKHNLDLGLGALLDPGLLSPDNFESFFSVPKIGDYHIKQVMG